MDSSESLKKWKEFGLNQQTEVRVLHVRDLIIERGGLKYGIIAAYKNVREGRKSKTEGPIQVCWIRNENKFLVFDGMHRLIEAIMRGEDELMCEIDWTGYSLRWQVPEKNDRLTFESIKSNLKQLIKEAAAEYVWGVKGSQRVANQYVRGFGMKLKESKLKELVLEVINEISAEEREGHKELLNKAMALLAKSRETSDVEKKAQLMKVARDFLDQAMGIEAGALKKAIQEADLEPEIRNLRQKMIQGLSQIPVDHRRPVYDFIGLITKDGDKVKVRETLMTLGQLFQEFENTLD
jgi:hypothetical protein